MSAPDTLAQALAKPLVASRVKTRPDGRGGQLSYLETHDVIRAANDLFGFGAWGHEIVELRQIASVVVHNKDQKPGVCVGYICAVRLTVEGCVPVSGVGFGDATEYRESAAVTAHELAAKEAESDALKRALKNYGDQFGLALYDKAAKTSGRVVSNPAAGDVRRGSGATNNAQADGAEPWDDGGFPPVLELEARLLELNAEYKTLKPDFDAGRVEKLVAEKRGKAGYGDWLRQQIKAFVKNIERLREQAGAPA